MQGLLLSGGMDSIALAYWKRPSIAITVDYGQRPATAEVRAAAKVAKELGIQHEVLRIDCRSLGSGDLAGTAPSPLAPRSEWWPFRNQLIATLAAGRALSLGVTELQIATVSTDGSHADGCEPFITAIDHLFSIQEGALRFVAPAIHLTTVELVRESGIPISLLAWAHSCHKANFACGRCGGCHKHRACMHKLGYEIY